MGELRGGDDDRRGFGSGTEEIRGENDADGEEGDGRQEPRGPRHWNRGIKVFKIRVRVLGENGELRRRRAEESAGKYSKLKR